MIKEELVKDLDSLIHGLFRVKNIELIDLILRPQGRKLVIRVLADYPDGGITLGECALLNRRLGDLIEEKELIASEYILEVSSPGLDRNLSSKKDFLRCKNKEAVFFLQEPVEGKLEWQATVINADDNNVNVKAPERELAIPLNKINKAHLLLKNNGD
ncbi:MAG: hypothetical protein WC442_03385 [Candidatus Omnitrophota bacterium]